MKASPARKPGGLEGWKAVFGEGESCLVGGPLVVTAGPELGPGTGKRTLPCSPRPAGGVREPAQVRRRLRAVSTAGPRGAGAPVRGRGPATWAGRAPGSASTQTQRPRPLGTRRRHLTRESATWPLRTFAGLRDHPLLGLTLHPLKFTSQIKPTKGDPGGQCVPAAPQAPCPPSAGDSDLGRAAAGRWARRVGPGRQWSSKQEAPESSFSLVSS